MSEIIVYYALLGKWNGDPTMRVRGESDFNSVRVGDKEYSWGRWRKIIRIENAPFGENWCKKLVLEK